MMSNTMPKTIMKPPLLRDSFELASIVASPPHQKDGHRCVSGRCCGNFELLATRRIHGFVNNLSALSLGHLSHLFDLILNVADLQMIRLLAEGMARKACLSKFKEEMR
jgi:hypothetical protein